MKYGLRITRSWLIGLVLAGLWFLIWMAFGNGPHSRAVSVFTFSVALLVFVLWPLETFMPRRNRYVKWALSTVVVAGFLLAMITGGTAAWTMQKTAGINAVLSTEYLGRAVWFFLIAAMLTFGPPLAVFLKEILGETKTLRDWSIEGRGEAARWAGPLTFFKYPGRFDPDISTRHIYLGYARYEENFVERPVFLDEADDHLLTVARSGSGKSLTTLWPVFASYCGGIFCIDPKGEHTDMFYRRRAELNDHVFALDPYGQSGKPCASYNLLSEIDITSPNCRKRVMAISSSCIKLTGGTNEFWQKASRIVLNGAIVHVLSKYPVECHNLPFVTDLLIGKDTSPDTSKRDTRADQKRMKALHDTMRLDDAAGGLPQLAAVELDNVGEKGYGYIITELVTALSWTTDPPMRKQLTSSSFRFADYEFLAMTIFLSLGFGHMVEQGTWMRCMINLPMRIFEDFKQKPDPRVLFILDEVRLYGDFFYQLEKDVTSMRGAGVRLWPILQFYSQLESCFSENGRHAFESSATIITFAVGDNDTANWISKKLGRKLHTKKTGRIGKRHKETHVVEMMEASTVTTKMQKNKPLAIVFPSDGFPMMLERTAFKTIRTKKQKYRGLPLEGTYDERPH